MKRRTPKVGDVWLDLDTDESGEPRRLGGAHPEIVLLTGMRKENSLTVWGLLVTKFDGSVSFDWEHPDTIDEWYDKDFAYMQRIV